MRDARKIQHLAISLATISLQFSGLNSPLQSSSYHQILEKNNFNDFSGFCARKRTKKSISRSKPIPNALNLKGSSYFSREKVVFGSIFASAIALGLYSLAADYYNSGHTEKQEIFDPNRFLSKFPEELESTLICEKKMKSILETGQEFAFRFDNPYLHGDYFIGAMGLRNLWLNPLKWNPNVCDVKSFLDFSPQKSSFEIWDKIACVPEKEITVDRQLSFAPVYHYHTKKMRHDFKIAMHVNGYATVHGVKVATPFLVSSNSENLKTRINPDFVVGVTNGPYELTRNLQLTVTLPKSKINESNREIADKFKNGILTLELNGLVDKYVCYPMTRFEEFEDRYELDCTSMKKTIDAENLFDFSIIPAKGPPVTGRLGAGSLARSAMRQCNQIFEDTVLVSAASEGVLACIYRAATRKRGLKNEKIAVHVQPHSFEAFKDNVVASTYDTVMFKSATIHVGLLSESCTFFGGVDKKTRLNSRIVPNGKVATIFWIEDNLEKIPPIATCRGRPRTHDREWLFFPDDHGTPIPSTPKKERGIIFAEVPENADPKSKAEDSSDVWTNFNV
eukprot:GHVP01042379.1.p1 GENE.GHVP01042379.1~~GHVP01042379.1.p1  ORF type:complete len:563 (+),score=94.69 GHVP01042379.1:140-1828(+)